jgi:CheY-like chemotaxis protein
MIDDDPEDQEIFLDALKKVNNVLECSTARNGEEALEKLSTQSLILPDIIFLDINMPKLNGKQVLRHLKNTGSLKEIPVIMYSTSFAPADLEETKILGASYHLLKPTLFDDLCQALVFILSNNWSGAGGNGNTIAER